jgi:TolA-binding protein
MLVFNGFGLVVNSVVACARVCLLTLLVAGFFEGSIVGQELTGDDAVEISEDAKLLEGLRQRQLFELADKYCNDLFAKKTLGPKRKVGLTVQRLKTLTAMAVFATKEQRPSVWAKIDQLAADFESTFRGSRSLLVKAQAALAKVAQVRLIRQELDAKLVDASAGKKALQLLRSARSQIEALIRDIEKAIPTAASDASGSDLAAAQLLELKTNMNFQFAVCNLERSRLYDPQDRASRTDALSQASKQIEDVTRSAQPGTDLWWEANLASSKYFRLAGEPQAASKVFERLPRPSVPAHLLTSFLIEKLQVLKDNRDVASVEQLVRELINSPGREARLDFALLEASVWLGEKSTGKAGNWKSFSTAMLKSIKSSHGGYWGRRAEIVLLGALDRGAIESASATEAATDADLTILIQLAENAQAENRFQVAADSFAKAIQLAGKLNSKATVFRLAVLQSQCYEKLKLHGKAAESLLLAATHHRLSNASAVHLRACWNLAQQTGQSNAKSDGESTARFESELERHLTVWPENETADTARFWLADHLRQRRQYQLAFERLLSIRQESPKLAVAIVAASESAVSLLSQMKAKDQSVDLMTDRLLGRLTEKAAENGAVTDLVALLRADIELRFLGQLPESDWLAEMSKVDWSSSTQSASLVDTSQAIAVVGSFNRLAGFQSKVASIDGQAVLKRSSEYLDSVWNRKKEASAARANLVVAERGKQVAQQQNDAGMIAYWQLRMADIQLALGENQAAIETLNLLVKQFPRKADLRIKLAQAVTEVYGKSDPDKAINQWRRLATKLRPQSENWFLAKYQVALLLAESGDRAAAEKLLKFMQANPPGWEQSKLKRDFDRLLRRVDR